MPFAYKEDYLRPKKKEVSSFIEEMIDFVSQAKVDESTDSIELKPTDKFPILNKYISRLLVYRNRSYTHWQKLQGGSTTLEEDILIKVIEPKLHKAKEYKAHNDIKDLWLIIGVGRLVSQVTPPPNFVEMHLKNFNKLEEMLKNSLFDEVYFYLSWWDTAFEWPGWKKIT